MKVWSNGLKFKLWSFHIYIFQKIPGEQRFEDFMHFGPPYTTWYVSNIWQFLWNFAILFLDNCSYEHHTMYYISKICMIFQMNKRNTYIMGVYARRKISWIKNICLVFHTGIHFKKINIQPNKIYNCAFCIFIMG